MRNTVLDDPLKAPIFILLTVLAVFTLAHGVRTQRSQFPVDFYHYWMVGQALQTGEAKNIYSRNKRIPLVFLKKITESPNASSDLVELAQHTSTTYSPTSTPFFYSLFAVFTTNDYDKDYERFRIFSLFSFVAGILIFGFILGFRGVGSMLLLLILTSQFLPFIRDVHNGNLNQVQLGALGLFFYCQRKGTLTWHLISGTLMGLLLFFKPNIVLGVAFLLLFWLIQRQKNQLILTSIGLLMGAILSLSISWIKLGSLEYWALWAGGFSKISMTRTFFHLFSLGSPNIAFFILIGLVLALAFVFLIFTRGYPKRFEIRTQNDILVFGLGLNLFLIVSPLIHLHYFILSLPLLIYLLRPAEKPEKAPTKGLLVRQVLGGIALFLVGDTTVHQMLGFMTIQNMSQMIYMGGLLAFFAGSSEFEKTCVNPFKPKETHPVWVKLSKATRLAHPLDMKRTTWFALILLFILGFGYIRDRKKGLTGEYFQDIHLNDLYKTRRDLTINFDWDRYHPLFGLTGNQFSVRWTGYIHTYKDGHWSFRTISDDGVRLWIDDSLIIDDWAKHPKKSNHATIDITSGYHKIKMEYFNDKGEARAQLHWRHPDLPGFHAIPKNYLIPSEEYLP